MPLKKYYFVIVLFASFLNIKAQFGGYTGCDWDKIKFDTSYVPTANDTAVIFVSTRNFFPDKKQFFDYDFDTTHTLHYSNIYFKGNKWICVKRNSLEEAFNGTIKTKDIVVYGEGMGKTFPSNIDRATRFTRLYNVTTIMFDWPTYRPFLTGGKNYKTARVQSMEVSKSMVRLFNDLDRLRSSGATGDVKLSLLLHSLGNRLIKAAAKHNFIQVKGKLFDNIVLNAPCINKRGHKEWMEKLKIQDHIYITRNNRDKTLILAGTLAFSKQLGRHFGLRKANNATYINFSKVLYREHNYFLMTNVLKEHPGLKVLYAELFHGKKPTFDDPKKFTKKDNGRLIILHEPHVSQDGDIGISIGM